MPAGTHPDRWALVLGGSGAMGSATIGRLAEDGFHIITLYREIAQREKQTRLRLEEIALQHGVTVRGYNWNALDTATHPRFLDAFAALAGTGRISVLVHAIARGNLKPLTGPDALSPAETADTLYAMSSSLLDWVQLLHRNRLFGPDARVIGLTSAGDRRYWPGYASVGMAKASLETLCRYLAVELAPFGVRTNVICAGVTRSDALLRIPQIDALLAAAAERNPSGRLTEPADVAGAIYLLTRPEARWINGSVLTVDGGEHCL